MTDASLPARVSRLEHAVRALAGAECSPATQDGIHLILAGDDDTATRAATLREAGDEITRALDDVLNGEPAESESRRSFQRGMLHARTAVRSLSLLPAPAPQPPEPVEAQSMEEAVAGITMLLDAATDHPAIDQRRALQQVRTLVDKTLGPQPPPADGLLEALSDIVEMIDNCADVPRNPDSLPMMVLVRARQALTAHERERAKEQGRG